MREGKCFEKRFSLFSLVLSFTLPNTVIAWSLPDNVIRCDPARPVHLWCLHFFRAVMEESP